MIIGRIYYYFKFGVLLRKKLIKQGKNKKIDKKCKNKRVDVQSIFGKPILKVKIIAKAKDVLEQSFEGSQNICFKNSGSSIKGRNQRANHH